MTQVLAAAGQGDAQARDQLWSLVYDELRRLARWQLAAEPAGRARQPTSLVHEAFLRLTAGEPVEWANRRHFFAAAAEAMRRIRVDDARTRGRLKRGGGRQREVLAEGPESFDPDPAEVLSVHEALDRLEQLDARKATVVKMRYFAGLTVDETAAAMDLSPRTVDFEWRFAKAWLHRELGSA